MQWKPVVRALLRHAQTTGDRWPQPPVTRVQVSALPPIRQGSSVGRVRGVWFQRRRAVMRPAQLALHRGLRSWQAEI